MNNRQIKVAISTFLTVLFCYFGVDAALRGIQAGYGESYAGGALLPFFFLLVITLDQLGKLRKERKYET